MTRTKATLTLVGIGLVTLVACGLALGLKFDYDFEDFFPKNDPETAFYFEFREAFESDNDFFFVALENNNGIFEKSFLIRVDSLTRSLRKIDEVVTVTGPTDLAEFVQDPVLGGLFKSELLRWNEPETYAIDSVRLFQTPGVVGVFIAPDARSLAIHILHTEMLSKEKCDVLSKSIEETVSEFSFDKTHLIGRALGQRVYVEMMIKELSFFVAVSLFLTLLFLFIAFRSGWGMIIPALVVLLSLLWTLGFMRIIGKDIDLMLTVLPTIIFVVGVSDSVHVLTKYLQELRKGADRMQAIRTAFRSIRLAMFLTSLTTAIGFLTLVLSNIQPISDFGLYTSVGILLAYGLTYLMLPSLLFLAKPKRLYDFAMSDDFWTRRLHRAFAWLLRSRRKMLWLGAGIIAISAGGIALVEVDNKMLEDLRDSHFLKQEFFFMEEHFAGCRPFEMGVRLEAHQDPMDFRMLRQLDTLQHFLTTSYGVGSAFSLPVLVRTSNRTLHAGLREYYALPESDEALARIQRIFRRKELKPALAMAWNPQEHMVRFSGKVGDIGRRHFEEKNAELDRFIAAQCPDLSNYSVTGTAHLIDLNNHYLVGNMIWNLLLSISVIGLVMGLFYRSWVMIPLTILPNILPLLILGGIMGYTGIPLKVSTSIIFNIAFGIAVDDTIHFMARARQLMNEGMSRVYAVKRTFLTTGKAMIVTTLILSGGFLSLVFSDFLGTFYIGLLISLTLFIALVAELIYTPLVVLMFYRKRSRLF